MGMIGGGEGEREGVRMRVGRKLVTALKVEAVD